MLPYDLGADLLGDGANRLDSNRGKAVPGADFWQEGEEGVDGGGVISVFETLALATTGANPNASAILRGSRPRCTTVLGLSGNTEGVPFFGSASGISTEKNTGS